ncbi:hypothetical protein COP2_036632 [Malus domestica]|uniref:putative F-box protein At1g23770 n=1 Tax=Malus domestica TaxID=3750 RepID=UPI0010AA9F5D|nr:F-box protein At1g70360-like [Malus domestica]
MEISEPVANKYSDFELFYLRLMSVLTEEFADDRSNRERLVIAVHAMLLEAGFVVFDPISGTQSSDRFHLLNKWPALDHRTMWVPYTLPHILHDIKRESINNSYVIQAVRGIALRFQSKRDTGLPLTGLNAIYIVKDEIVLPFQIELGRNPGFPIVLPFPIEFGQKPGSASPTGIMGLPSELKMKVLESLPGVDIVKLACVCKGMKNMVNDVIDELLWRDKYYEEIERGVESPAKRRRGQRGEVIVEWKLLFVRIWKSKAKWKQLEKQRQVAPSPFRCMQYRSAKRNQRSSA